MSKAVYPDHLRVQVDAYLGELSFSDDAATDGVAEAMKYSLLAGGKRIRPVLALATACALGRDPADVMPYAAALELVHTYSLIHDDLPAMDDDDLRRGRPTCHVAFGENVAILAGDALFSEAVNLTVSARVAADADTLRALRRLVAATGPRGMVGGQYIDVVAGDLGPEHLRQLHQLKTGKLIEASVTGAAALLGASEQIIDQLESFASELGVLFQIVDDILDVVGTDDELGKPQGSDQRHGKSTYVSLYGIDRARELAKESHERALTALEHVSLPTTGAELWQVSNFISDRNN